MKRSIFIIIALVLAVIGLGTGVARKPWDPKVPQDEWVEVRKAKKATKEEVARANSIENAKLQLSLVKSQAKKATAQRAYDKELLKKQSKQIAALTKAVKAEKVKTIKAEKEVMAKDREIGRLHDAVRKWAFKRSGWISMAIALAIGSGVLAFTAGLLIGAFIRKKRVVERVVVEQPSAPPLTIVPTNSDGQ